MAKVKVSATLRKYRALQKAKRKYCEGKATKKAVTSAASAYISAAVAKGQTKSEATAKANRVTKGGCKMTSRVSGKRKKTTTRTVRTK